MAKTISISILNVEQLESFLNKVKEVNSRLEKISTKIQDLLNINVHFDVMDGKFVSNTGVDLEKIKVVKEFGFFVDVHLMVENPIEDGYIDKAIEYGADNVTIHREIKEFEKALTYLKKKVKSIKERNITIGVSIKPETNMATLGKYIDVFDLLLVMSVEPGYGGQEYIENVGFKLSDAKEKFGDKIIQVDGGINFDTISEPIRRLCDNLVIGSYLTKDSTLDILYRRILEINIINSIELSPRNGNLELDTKILQIIPGGYGEGDILLGISVPDIRLVARKWYKYLDINVLQKFITSKYHDYRRFAIFCINEIISRENDLEEMKNIVDFVWQNITYINNWDLTDEVGPNIVGKYLLKLSNDDKKEVILKYINDDRMWVRRIGIVSLLTLVRDSDTELPLYICDLVIYEDYHLFQKATGWVLREIYKKDNDAIIKYLKEKNNNKKLPSILLSYATEKMSKEQKEYIRNKEV